MHGSDRASARHDALVLWSIPTKVGLKCQLHGDPRREPGSKLGLVGEPKAGREKDHAVLLLQADLSLVLVRRLGLEAVVPGGPAYE